MNALLPDRAVIMARGLGTRMRAADASATLAPAQAAVADSGVKAMIPVGANARIGKIAGPDFHHQTFVNAITFTRRS